MLVQPIKALHLFASPLRVAQPAGHTPECNHFAHLRREGTDVKDVKGRGKKSLHTMRDVTLRRARAEGKHLVFIVKKDARSARILTQLLTDRRHTADGRRRDDDEAEGALRCEGCVRSKGRCLVPGIFQCFGVQFGNAVCICSIASDEAWCFASVACPCFDG